MRPEPLPAVWVVDVDGVIAGAGGHDWTAGLETELGIAPAQLREFSRAEWPACVEGRRDTAEVLVPWLRRWGARCDAEGFIAWWHGRDTALDEPLLVCFAAWRAAGARLLLATNQDNRCTRHLWYGVGLADSFDAMIHSAAVGARKPDVAFWQAVADVIGPHEPRDVVVVDDTAANLDGAAPFEWRTHHFTGRAGLLARFGL